VYYCIYHYVQRSISCWGLLYRKTRCNIILMYIMYRGVYPAGACCTGRQDVILYLCTLCTGEHIHLVLVVQEDKMKYYIFVHYVHRSISFWCLLYRKTGCKIVFMYTMYWGAYPPGACCTGRQDVTLYLCTLCAGEHILLVFVVQEDKV